ncbi:hypothetical protein DTL39_25340, partial [Escherichia coli]
MNSQTTKDITGFRSYFPDVLRLIFEEQLSVRAIALEQLGLSHSGFAPIFPDICYHLTHYKPAAADIPVASDNPAHYADAIRYN